MKWGLIIRAGPSSSTSPPQEAILLRSQVKTLQDALAQKATALGDLTTQHTALSGQVQQMDARRKTVADRYRVGELDAAEHTLVKIITRGVQASTQKTQVDLENQLKRAERTIQNLKNEKEVLEKERNKQCVQLLRQRALADSP